MIIYLDENLPPHLAEGFDVLQQPENLKTGYSIKVAYIPQVFGRGAKDVDWLPQLETNACVITQDANINRVKHEMELYRKHGIGMFFLRGASSKQGLSVWEMVQTLAKNWPKISKIAHKEERPFAYRITLGRAPKRLK